VHTFQRFFFLVCGLLPSTPHGEFSFPPNPLPRSLPPFSFPPSLLFFVVLLFPQIKLGRVGSLLPPPPPCCLEQISPPLSIPPLVSVGCRHGRRDHLVPYPGILASAVDFCCAGGNLSGRTRFRSFFCVSRLCFFLNQGGGIWFYFPPVPLSGHIVPPFF